MSRLISLSCLLLANTLTAFAADAPRKETPRTASSPLSAEERQIVQGVSVSVLQARRHATEPAESAALAQELASLREAIGAALTMRPVALSVSAAPADAGERAWGHEPALRAHVRTLHARQTEMRAAARTTTERLRTEHLSKAASGVETELQTALAAPAPERVARLMKLYEELRVRSAAEQQQALYPQASMQPAPTLVTITEHR